MDKLVIDEFIDLLEELDECLVRAKEISNTANEKLKTHYHEFNEAVKFMKGKTKELDL